MGRAGEVGRGRARTTYRASLAPKLSSASVAGSKVGASSSWLSTCRCSAALSLARIRFLNWRWPSELVGLASTSAAPRANASPAGPQLLGCCIVCCFFVVGSCCYLLVSCSFRVWNSTNHELAACPTSSAGAHELIGRGAPMGSLRMRPLWLP